MATKGSASPRKAAKTPAKRKKPAAANLPTLTVPVAQVIRENVSELMAYVFSREPIENLIAKTFEGEWHQLRHTIFDLSRQRAERACIELAVFLRYLDDQQKIAKRFAHLSFGQLYLANGRDKKLTLRHLMNKIIHAQAFDWDLTRALMPLLICIGRGGAQKDDWVRAEVRVVTLAAVCGSVVG